MSKKWFLIAWCAVAAAGCKQGLGDRCEVNGDCSSGICSESPPKVCVSMSGQNDQIDAQVPMDAPDAAVAVDAAADAADAASP